jgi:hypothetical protein
MATQKIPGRAIKLGNVNAPQATGDVAYFDGAAWQRLAIGIPGQRLTMNEAGTLPHWGYCYGGTQFGYTHGGNHAGNNSVYTDTIDKFSFTTDGNATDVGNLNEGRAYMGGFHSSTHGYAVSGQRSFSTGTKSIDKYSFITDGNSTNVGDLVTPVLDDDRMCVGLNNAAKTMGYAVAFETATTTIQKISTVTDGNAVASAGTLSIPTYNTSKACSAIFGYIAGGWNSPAATERNDIQKFAFATDSDSTDVGDLLAVKYHTDAGGSSCTHGYSPGASSGPTTSQSNVIEKYSFATDGNSTDVGDLSYVGGYRAGQSSQTFGYITGGPSTPSNTERRDEIEKYSFSADGNSTDVGNLFMARYGAAGTEY